MNVLDFQKALKALGYNPGPLDDDFGPKTMAAMQAFQEKVGLPKTKKLHQRTYDAVLMAAKHVGIIMAPESNKPVVHLETSDGVIPLSWMPAAKMSRIVVHWTVGNHKASEFDRKHYHILINGDGKLVRGIPTIDLNGEPRAKKGYAAHTLNCNTGSIGVSLAGMVGATESPFSAGSQPITMEQWNALPAVLAALCKRYAIKVSRETVLSHAEVQPTLKISQRGKIDIRWLPGMDKLGDPIVIGDMFREATKRLL